MGAWRETLKGEWWEDDLGVVIGVQGTIWFGYPEHGAGRVGPFASLLEAQRALEHERSGEIDARGATNLGADDDRPTERRQQPGGVVRSAGGAKR